MRKKDYEGCGTVLILLCIFGAITQFLTDYGIYLIFAILIIILTIIIVKVIKSQYNKKKYLTDSNKISNQNVSKSENCFALSVGRYIGGETIIPGIYDLSIVSGSGIIKTEKPVEQFIRLESNPIVRENRNLSDSYCGFVVDNDSIVEISESAKIEFKLVKPIYDDESDNRYIQKRDNIKLEIEKLEKILDSKKSMIENKKEILNQLEKKTKEEKSKLDNIKREFDKYEQNLKDFDITYNNKRRKLENEYQEKYSGYCESYNRIQSEIETIRSEMKILNNEVIEKYYVVSDYDGITSQDCKNELILLKSEEKRLRDSDDDIMIINEPEKKKLLDRSIRQIIRNFNSDCNNQILNISVKNIDVVRNRIQKSYDTLNKLYSVDGVALSEEILELKLKQATLMYTYELKHQEEKDIQQAIKEQMIEEAKAEREIQEQKKKIEKDLQQHLGEVNRLMKYLQKSQIDAERQLYIDKIKELEEKIKFLESDKETVLEREANAKAGFVYIISNIGSFGEDIYKIGMTRRLEPMDRIKELSSASVPFEFDVHAMIFSSDAPELETLLHQHFSDRAVNKINPRKEFYHVNIDEIEQIVKENYNDTVQFTKIPLATEYRQSLELYKNTD